MLRIFTLVIIMCFGLLRVEAQNKEELIQAHLNKLVLQEEFQQEDIDDWAITDWHLDRRTGIEFVYISQKLNGIRIENSHANIAIKDNKIRYFGNQLITQISANASAPQPGISAEQAIRNASALLQLPAPQTLEIEKRESETKWLFNKGGISLESIPVELLYFYTENGEMKLVWDLSIYELDAQNWWSLMIDANSGEMLRKHNWVNHCEFDHPNEAGAEHQHKHRNNTQNKIQSGGTYNVLPVPLESPNHGPRALLVNPADSLGSPFGWHDTDGQTGAEYTITRGNNVHAYEDSADNNIPGFSPDGGTNLVFDFPYNQNNPPHTYKEAAITNLFYMNNMNHDIWYHYGFDEASGNFQVDNYGRAPIGTGVGGDDVRAEAQDGGGFNNANFGTPPDGSRPRMQMYLWNTANPFIDGDFDNGIITHEYGHGISNRLVGGASQSGCLQNEEQMGEGWSDWFALMLSIESGDMAADIRGIGTFALNQPTTGVGIRPAPYSTDFSVNSFTYGQTNNSNISRPHGLGFIYATAMWDLTWALINQYGGTPDQDLYTGTGGNNIAMNLIITSLKLLNCNPGMIDGRNSILAADQLLYNGAHKCLIWDVFARRGFGWAALQGNTDNRSDQIESFLNNPYCITPSSAPIANFGVDTTNAFCGTSMTFLDSSLNDPQQWIWDFGDGGTDTFPNPEHVYNAPGVYNVQLIVNNTLGSDTISKTINVTYPEGPNVADRAICEGQNVVLIALNPIGDQEWYDLSNNLLNTGPIYILNNVVSDRTILARNNPTGGGPFCLSEFDTVNVTAVSPDFSYTQVGPTVNFTDQTNGATSWSWNFGDGNTSTLQNPSHNYASAGNYNVTLTVNGNCSGTSQISVISAIEGNIENSIFNIYPNPASTSVRIDISEQLDEDVRIVMLNLTGEKLLEERIARGMKHLDIDLSDFSESIYILRLETKDHSEIRKLVIE